MKKGVKRAAVPAPVPVVTPGNDQITHYALAVPKGRQYGPTMHHSITLPAGAEVLGVQYVDGVLRLAVREAVEPQAPVRRNFETYGNGAPIPRCALAWPERPVRRRFLGSAVLDGSLSMYVFERLDEPGAA